MDYQIRNGRLLAKAEEYELSTAIQPWRDYQEFRKTLTDAQIAELWNCSERELNRRIQAALKVRDEFVDCNIPLVVSIVGHSFHSKISKINDFQDLVSMGCKGLLRAIEKFDHTRGYKFSTYATRWIHQSIDRQLVDTHRLIRLPVHIEDKINRVRRATEVLSRKLGRVPTDDELLDLLIQKGAIKTGRFQKPPKEQLRRIREWSLSSTTLNRCDAEVGEDWIAFIPDHDATEMRRVAEMRDEIQSLMVRLTDQQKEIVALYYGLNDEPMAFHKIAEKLGVSPRTVTYVHGRAMQRMRYFAGIDVRQSA